MNAPATENPRLQRLVMTGNLMAAHLQQLCDRIPERDQADAIEGRLAQLWESALMRYVEEGQTS